jgi:hypothetical protein
MPTRPSSTAPRLATAGSTDIDPMAASTTRTRCIASPAPIVSCKHSGVKISVCEVPQLPLVSC